MPLPTPLGGEWPERARKVAEELSGETEQAIGIMLLEDVNAAFTEKRVDRFSSKELCDILNEREDRPWPEFKNGKPLTQRQLARLLEPFGIIPGSIRTKTEQTAKGYYAAAFDDAFKRYLPLFPVDSSGTPSQPKETLDF